MITAELMPHQCEGVEFLLRNKSGLLAFEQGLGKTLVAIAAFGELREKGIVDRLLVMCPNSLKTTWLREIERFAPGLGITVIEGTRRYRKETLACSSEPVVVINYESARNEIAAISAVLRKSRCVLVLDESHTVKNLSSLNSIAARSFSPLAQYRWLLSGTPVTNRPADIRSQIEVIDPSHPLGSGEMFELEFGDADRNPLRRRELSQKLKRYVLRRTKDECLALPEKSFTDILVELPDWQRSLYDQVRTGLLNEVNTMSNQEYRRFVSVNALTRLLRLSQVASNPSLVFRDETRLPAKFEELDRLVDATVADSKIIIWSSYVSTIEALTERYSRVGVVALWGGVPPEQRQAVVSQFQSDDRIRVLVANPAAAGTGFTLTAATLAIYESLSWRYDYYAQSQDRNHRIGQNLRVRYARLIARNTVEEMIVAALERKDRMAQEIIAGRYIADPISALTRKQFCALFLSEKIASDAVNQIN